MTLNIMMTSRHSVYLSGDFCISYKYLNKCELDLTAKKLIPIGRYEWNALVSFCGLAKLPRGTPVGSWISHHVQAGKRDESVDDFVDRIMNDDKWIQQFAARDRYLTICICGFHGRRPFSICLSNFEGFDGKLSGAPRKRLTKSGLNPKKPQVHTFGTEYAFDSKSRDALRARLKGHDTTEIRDAIAEANKKASIGCKYVSAECCVGHLLPSGSGTVSPYGIDPGSAYMPDFVLRRLVAEGMTGFSSKRSDNGVLLPPRWKGMALKSEKEPNKGKGRVLIEINVYENIEKFLGKKLAATRQKYFSKQRAKMNQTHINSILNGETHQRMHNFRNRQF